MDGDGKLDITATNGNGIGVVRNLSTPGNILARGKKDGICTSDVNFWSENNVAKRACVPEYGKTTGRISIR